MRVDFATQRALRADPGNYVATMCFRFDEETRLLRQTAFLIQNFVDKFGRHLAASHS